MSLNLGVWQHGGMKLTMNTTHLPTIKQMADFVMSSQALTWQCSDRAEAYDYITKVLRRQDYAKRSKPHKGIIRAYLMQVTGYSRAQLARLLAGYLSTGEIVPLCRS